MNRKVKVVEINGFRGMLVIAFAIVCAIAGFIVFPAWALMSLWNVLGNYIYNLPHTARYYNKYSPSSHLTFLESLGLEMYRNKRKYIGIVLEIDKYKKK